MYAPNTQSIGERRNGYKCGSFQCERNPALPEGIICVDIDAFSTNVFSDGTESTASMLPNASGAISSLETMVAVQAQDCSTLTISWPAANVLQFECVPNFTAAKRLTEVVQLGISEGKRT